jgi:hypothetical protein
LLPALPEVERGVIIEASEDTAVAARVAAAGIASHRVALPDTQASKTFQARRRRGRPAGLSSADVSLG